MTNSYKLFYIQSDEVDYFGDSGWTYRKAITLSSATSVTDYQIKIELTTTNFDYSKAQLNGEDIRFYQTDGTSLSYWIETWNALGTSTIWVKVVTSGTNTIYMYYGNDESSDASNGNNTFIAYHGAASSTFLDSVLLDPTTEFIYEAYVKTTSTPAIIMWGMKNAGETDDFHIHSTTNADNKVYLVTLNNSTQSYVSEAPALTVNTLANLKITRIGSTIRGYVNDNEISTGITTNLPDETLGIYMRLYVGTGSQNWSRVRKYTANEPIVTFGTEETFANDIISYTIDFKLERELEKLLDKLTLKVSRRIDYLSGFTGFDPNIELLLKFNETGIFRGRCKTSNKKEYYTIEAFSCAEILSRTMVQKVYSNTTPEAIFEDIINTYTDLTPTTIASGVTIDRFFADDYISTIVNKLSEALGYLIYTDSSKNIYFTPRGNTISGITIQRQTSGSNAIFGEWKREYNEMCNDIRVTGDNVNYSTQESFTGDFSSTIFTLSEIPNTIKIAVNSTELLPEKYVVAKESKTVTLTSAPASSIVVLVDYVYAYPIFAARQDKSSIETYGKFTKGITNKWLKTRPDTTAYANNYISKYSNPLLYNNIVMSASYITSFTPGESVRIIDDLESIDDYYIINKIKLEYLKGVVELNVGDYLEEFIGIQRVLQGRVSELEKSEMRLTVALNVSETEILIPAETFILTSSNYLNFKIQSSNPPKCDEIRGSLNDARASLCQC